MAPVAIRFSRIANIRHFLHAAACVTALCIAAHAQDPAAQSAVPSNNQAAKHPVHIVAKTTTKPNLSSTNPASAPFCINSSGNSGTCTFNYYGGPVISNPDVVVAYWKSTISSVVDCGGGTDSHGNCIGVSRFLGALTDSTFVDMLQEYNTAGVTPTAGSGTTPGTQKIGRGTLHTGSPFVITPHAANSGSPISDTQIQNEIQQQIADGVLPAPTTDSTGNVNTLYFVYFPPGLVISDPSVGTSCVAGGFCAYHGTLSLNAKDVPYGVIPDFGVGSGCDVGCGSGTEFQNITSASSHEYAESTTDTGVGLAATYGPPLGWYDVNNGEIGDPCNQNTDTLTFDSITYTFQQEFSQKSYKANHNAGCVSPGSLVFTLTAPASSSAGTAFDVTLKVVNSDGSTYTGPVHFTSGDPAATLPNDYTFTNADAGTHKFVGETILNTNGNQTITAADAHQPDPAGTATVSVTGATKSSTTTTLTSSVNPSTYNEPVTFTAVITATSGSPTGVVTFKNGASTVGTGTVSGGMASIMVSTIAVGTQSITAVYGGDSNFSSSGPALLSQVVNRASTITVLTSSPNPSVINQQVTFTATVTGSNGGGPTGTVSFKQGTTTLATKSLAGGSASFTTTYTSSGARSLTAAYSGDGNYLSSTSATHTHTVSKAPTTTTLSASKNPSNWSDVVMFTASVSSTAGTPANGDTVKFIDGSTTLGTGSLASGVASFTTTALSAGTHKLKATFVGDSSYTGSSCTILSQVVNGVPTTSTVSSNVNPSVYGQVVTLTATVTDNTNAATPTGTVSFKAGTAVLAKVAISGGKASFSTSSLGAGTKSITVTYNGDSKYATSTSASLSQGIIKATSTTNISSSVNPSTPGQSVTFTISVAPQFTGIPIGTVKLTMGSTVLTTVTLASGTATYSTMTLPSGANVIKATYNGSGNFNGSSGSITQTVN